MNRTYFYLIVFTLTFMLFSNVCSQEVGEIFTSTEADSLFGQVVESYNLQTNELEQLLSMCSDYIMFRLENNELHVLDGDRNILQSSLNYIDDSVIFKYYSKSKVEELIRLGGSELTTFENREEIFSVTNGLITLEKSWPCPPLCDDEYNYNLSFFIK